MPWQEVTLTIGEALGREDLAEERIGAYERRAMTIGDAIRAELGATRPSR